MSRINALNALKEYVKEEKNIKFKYVEENEAGEKCYCAVGFLFKQYGIDDETLSSFKQLTVHNDDVLFKVKANAEDLFEEFTNIELQELQHYNDLNNENYSYGQEPSNLLQYIDKLLIDGNKLVN